MSIGENSPGLEFLEEFDQYYTRNPKIRYEVQHKKRSFLRCARNIRLSFDEKTVLDLGFGFGEMLFQFEASSAVYGAELSPVAVRRATATAGKKGYRGHAQRIGG